MEAEYVGPCQAGACTGTLLKTSVSGVSKCDRCSSCFYLSKAGVTTSLTNMLLMLDLGDDKLRAAVSPDAPGTIDSIPQEFSRDWAIIQHTMNGFGGRLTQRLAQLQARLHFLHGQLAGSAMAHPELAPLVETAKQALDLVVSRPDGPVAEPPRGDAG